MKNIASIVLDKYEGVSEQHQVFNKGELISALETGVYLVEFIKVSGEVTTMETTLQPGLLPVQKENGQPRTVQDHLIHAFSPDRNGWRSFTVANVRSFTRKS